MGLSKTKSESYFCYGYKSVLTFYLQDDPVTFFGGDLHFLFSYNFLTLTQGHIVEVSIVPSKP